RRVLAPGDRAALHLRELRNARTGFNWAAGDPADIFLSAGPEHSIGFAPNARFRIVSHENRMRDDSAAELKLELLSEARGLKMAPGSASKMRAAVSSSLPRLNGPENGVCGCCAAATGSSSQGVCWGPITRCIQANQSSRRACLSAWRMASWTMPSTSFTTI